MLGKRPFVVVVVVHMEISLRQGGEVKERTIQRVLDHCRALEKKYPKTSNIQRASDVEYRKKLS